MAKTLEAHDKLIREIFEGSDLPPKFHPMAIRVSADVTPLDAV
jgi:hypothetical protein